jgi:hypothetical protein
VWWRGTCSKQGVVSVVKLLLYVNHHSPSLLPFFRFLYLSGRKLSRARMRVGVSECKFDWPSKEVSGLVEHTLKLVLYM